MNSPTLRDRLCSLVLGDLAKSRKTRSEALWGLLFVGPQMAGFLVLVLVPLLSVFVYSFQSKNLLFGTSEFAGLANYLNAAADPQFGATLLNTLTFSVGMVPLNLAASLALAFLLAGSFAGVRTVRSIVFLPVVTSAVAWSIVWKFLLQGGEAGVVNALLAAVGIRGPDWLQEPGWAMAAVVATRVLKNLGMNVLIFIGAILNIPSDVVEAGTIDGAGRLRMLRSIKIPLLMPTVLMVTVVTVIGSLRVFDSIKLMTDGGPEGSTMVLVYYIYHMGFKVFDIGYASTLAVLLFLVVLALTALQWGLRKKVSYHEAD